MKKLFIPRDVCDRLVTIVCQTPEGLETGVTLWGTRVALPEPHPSVPPDGSAREPDCVEIVLAVAGPGGDATHEPAHYSGDDGYANAIYETLQSAMPGIQWLGELHVHPDGMCWLSAGDLRTVRKILIGDDDTLHPGQFIAGVIQRKNGGVDLYPFHFTREGLEGSPMEVQIVDVHDVAVRQARLKGAEHDRPSICEKSEGSRTALHETSRHCWLWQWWQRVCRYGRQVRHR